MPEYTREDVTFDSWGRRCAAWLYRPDGAAEGTPCVVMAHGWTGIREARLDAFAERFAAAGLGVVCFDYRHFGASEGTPRQLLSIRRQHEDYASALTFARALPWVDADRIVLWGTSFSGGHVQHMAAIDQRVAAVIANVPFTDGLKTLLRLGVGHSAKLTVEGLKDVATILRRRPPYMVASVGPPGSTAVMTTPDAEPGFKALIPAGVEWPNEAAARIALLVGLYRPALKAERISCPILYCVADDDAITPPDLAHEAAARAPQGELRRYPGGHFDPYVEPHFSRVAADQVEFLAAHGLARAEAMERTTA